MIKAIKKFIKDVKEEIKAPSGAVEAKGKGRVAMVGMRVIRKDGSIEVIK